MFSRLINLKNLILVIFLVSALAVLSININKPFVGQHDFMGAFEGSIAKNFLVYGPFRIKFAQVAGPILNVDNIQSFHLSYLPLLPIIMALSYKLFGVSEAAARLVPIIFSVIGVYFFFKILDRVWNEMVAIMGTFFYIFNPMFIYYGKLTTTEPPIISCSLAAFYFYLKWLEKKDKKNLVYILIWILIGGLIGWPIMYIGPLILLHSFLIGEFALELLLPTILAIFTVLLLFLYSFILTGSFLTPSIMDTLRFRLTDSSLSFGGLDFNFKSYLRQEISWIQAYFTRTLLAFSVIGVIANLRRRFDFKRVTLLVFFIFGISHLLIFSRYVFIHDFMNFFLLPFLALSGALGLDFLVRFFKEKKINWFIIYGGVVIAFLIFLLERINFSQALLNTKMNDQGQMMGDILNRLQTKPNQVVIASPRFNSFFGPFTSYYSNYAVSYSTDKDLEKKGSYKNFKYVVTFDEDITDKNFYDQLVGTYPSQRSGEMTIIKTND